MRNLKLLVLAGVVLSMGSCSDPVHDQQVQALGPERDGVPVGEFHRAGQPCVTCHGQYGPASQRFTVAGTIFDGPGKPLGVDQAEVEMIDALGNQPSKRVFTNCVGNFFVTSDIWDPAFPVLVWVRKGDAIAKMNSHIGREPSCNQCHQDAAGTGASFDTPGHIHVNGKDTPNPPQSNCPVSPIANIAGGASP